MENFKSLSQSFTFQPSNKESVRMDLNPSCFPAYTMGSQTCVAVDWWPEVPRPHSPGSDEEGHILVPALPWVSSRRCRHISSKNIPYVQEAVPRRSEFAHPTQKGNGKDGCEEPPDFLLFLWGTLGRNTWLISKDQGKNTTWEVGNGQEGSDNEETVVLIMKQCSFLKLIWLIVAIMAQPTHSACWSYTT